MNYIRTATLADAESVLEIYAPFCLPDAPASFENVPPTLDEMRERIRSGLPDFPWLVYEEDERVLGYASASLYKTRAAYAWSATSSIYLHEQARGRAVGKKLYARLFEILKELGYFNVYAGITLPNDASIGLHKSMGFVDVGTTPKVGYKGGAWHDVANLWLTLKSHTLQPPLPRKFADLKG